MLLVHSRAELDAALAEARAEHKQIALVPTMGALHEGHLSLIDLAHEAAAFVVVSIFVNPLQFGAGEDFDRYPRTLDADVAMLGGLRNPPQIVFAPDVETIYGSSTPPAPKPRAGAIGATFEGIARPGHFDGMLEVVSRLFDLVQPDFAIFGAKDAQQVHLVRRMIQRERAGLPQLIEADTVREEDGLALSSRNRFLSAEAREAATVLVDAMIEVVAAIEEDGASASQALAAGRQVIEAEPSAKLEYLALVDKSTFAPIADDFVGEAQLIVAAIVGGVRLLDNLIFEIGE